MVMHGLFRAVSVSVVEAGIAILASIPLSVGEYHFRKLEVLSDVVNWCSHTHTHTLTDTHLCMPMHRFFHTNTQKCAQW